MDSLWLSVESEDPVDGLEELTDWLRHEPELRGLVTPVETPPGPGELGSLADILSVAVGSGGALSVLISSLKVFLAQPRRSDVNIVVRGADGHVVKIDAKRVRDVEELVRQAMEPHGELEQGPEKPA